MARKSYTDEFRRQAVDLYESTPGATLKGIAADLGIGRGTLQGWVRGFGSGAVSTSVVGSPGSARPESKSARIACLEAENVKLTVERDILRAAAKYFAGETIW
jgi:transposase